MNAARFAQLTRAVSIAFFRRTLASTVRPSPFHVPSHFLAIAFALLTATLGGPALEPQ